MKISVIIPVYNAEKFLKKCLDSIIAQTYENWELILVDDGSTDSSSEIIDNIAKSEKRIIPIHQTNAGPGIARNNGIAKATGDFVVFIDSDDYIDKDYFKLLVEHSKDNDIVFIDVLQVKPDGKVIKEQKMSPYKAWSKDKITRCLMTGKFSWGGWRKAVRLDMLKENNIVYTEHAIGEEALYTFRILKAASHIGFIDEKPVYYYVNHANSQSKTVMDDPWGGAVSVLAEYLKENGLYEEYADTLNAFNITATVISIDRINLTKSGNEKKQCLKNRVKELTDSIDKNFPIDTFSMSTKAKIFIPFLTKGIYLPVVLFSDLRSKI